MPDPAMKIDALFTILEKHLYDFDDQDESEQAFIDKIVNDYLRFLATSKVAVPGRWLPYIVEELRDQVRKMLVKKMYGCLSIQEYLARNPNEAVRLREAKKKYKKMF